MKEHLYENRVQNDNSKFKDGSLDKSVETQKQETPKVGPGYKYLYDQVHISGPTK